MAKYNKENDKSSVIHSRMNFAKINEFKPLLLEIGKESMLIINESRKDKNEIWEAAIKINQITHRLHDTLDHSDVEESCKEDPTQWG